MYHSTKVDCYVSYNLTGLKNNVSLDPTKVVQNVSNSFTNLENNVSLDLTKLVYNSIQIVDRIITEFLVGSSNQFGIQNKAYLCKRYHQE